jgi:hypothetical protein
MFCHAARDLWPVGSPLRRAIVNGDVPAMGTLIAGGANLEFPVRLGGMTALILRDALQSACHLHLWQCQVSVGRDLDG